jgi:hypothetical protein
VATGTAVQTLVGESAEPSPPNTIIPDPTSAKSFDRYAYVENNPINASDPSGHCLERPASGYWQENGRQPIGVHCGLKSVAVTTPGPTMLPTPPSKVASGTPVLYNMDYARGNAILAYMHGEMILNAQSAVAGLIKSLNASNDPLKKLDAVKIYYSYVQSGGPWDHKNYLANNFIQNGDFYTPIKGDREHEFYYDIWSNIHYGYVGRAAGFSASELIDAANIPLPGVGFVSTVDNISMWIGIELWEKYGHNLTMENLRIAIINAANRYLDAQTKDPRYSAMGKGSLQKSVDDYSNGE